MKISHSPFLISPLIDGVWAGFALLVVSTLAVGSGGLVRMSPSTSCSAASWRLQYSSFSMARRSSGEATSTRCARVTSSWVLVVSFRRVHCFLSMLDYKSRSYFFKVVAGCLLNVPATCQCVWGTDLHRQFYVLPHWDTSCRSKFLPHPVTVYWHQADQSQRWPYNARHLAG